MQSSKKHLVNPYKGQHKFLEQVYVNSEKTEEVQVQTDDKRVRQSAWEVNGE